MGDMFDGTDHFDLQPGTSNKPLTAKFNPCSASTLNDGSIPYGSTLSTGTVVAHRGDDTTVNASTSIVGTVAFSSNRMTAYLSFTTGVPAGNYHLVFKPVCSLPGSALFYTGHFDYDRVFLGNR